MIESAHQVLLYDTEIGHILQRGDVARFVFSNEYWTSRHRSVLGLWFEDHPRESPHVSMRLPAWFSNLLPEGKLREWIALDYHVSVQRELPLLLRIGHDLPGAVQVLPSASQMSFDPRLIEGTPFNDSDEGFADSVWKFSLAGVGLKFSMLKKGDRLTIPSGGELGNWIVKFPDSTYQSIPQNEHASMVLAGLIGINVPEVRLVHRDALPSRLPEVVWPGTEEYAYAIKRFDRGANGERIHIEDFAQIRGFYSGDKYVGSFETVAALAYRNHDRPALREFVRRLTFNILIGNGDAHLKNWSLIYIDRKRPTLSPAYDLVSTAPYSMSSTPDDLGLKLNKNKIFDRVNRHSFVSLQRKIGAANEDVIEIMDETVSRFLASWRDGHGEDFPSLARSWIDDRLPAVTRRLQNGS